MSFKPSEEEEKYFKAEDERRLTALRGEIQADEETKARWLALAEVVGSSSHAVGRRLEELGFNTDTARVLFFVPLVEIAWADGKIGYEESYKLVDELRKRGIRATTQAYEFLNSITLRRPHASFFEGCTEVLRELFGTLSAEQRDAHIGELTGLADQVARASRGFFGFGAEVSKEERSTIEDIIKGLGIEHSSQAAQLLRSL